MSHQHKGAGGRPTSMIVGAVYGPLTVVGFEGKKVLAKCRECEKTVARTRDALYNARARPSKSCGCLGPSGRSREEAVGTRFGRWVVLKDLGMRIPEGYAFPNPTRWLLVRCGCGAEHERRAYNLRSGGSTQCLPCGSRESGAARRLPRLCQFCGRDGDETHFAPRITKQCGACLRRATRNGRCETCRFPLYARRLHTCRLAAYTLEFLAELESQVREATNGGLQ